LAELDRSVNERVVQARKLLGLTQAKFAERIKISNGYIAALELGNRRVNDRIIRMISMNFGVSEEWLKTGAGECFDRIDDYKLEQVIGYFRKLDPCFQDYVLKQFDILLDLQNKKAGE
jgi:transcriptional regulator with XRE-family HTH domain